MKSIFMIFSLVFVLISCGKEETTDELRDLIAIEITNNGNMSVIKESEKIRFFAQGTFKDGSTKVLDVTKLKWTTLDSSVAYISDDGLFTAIRQGVTIISASYKEIESNEVNMRIVSEDGLQSIETKVSSSSSKFFVGETYQFRAIGEYGTGDKQDITESVLWKTSDENIATISNSFGSFGRLTVKSAGTVEVYCILNGIHGNHIPIKTEEININEIVLSVDKTELYVDERVKVSVVAKLSNDNDENITNDVEWHYETTLVPDRTDDNLLSGSQAGVYKFHVSYKGKNSNTISLNIEERVGVLNNIELIVSPNQNVYQNETVITIKVLAHYSDHDEEITGLEDTTIYLSALPPNEDYDIDDCYTTDSSGLIFIKSGNFRFEAEYKSEDDALFTSEKIDIHVNELENGVKPELNELVINEILIAPADGINGDANNDGITNNADDGFIEIVNVTDKVLDLTDVYLSNLNDEVIAAFPDNTLIRPHQVIVIFGGGNPTGDFGGATVFTLGSNLSLDINGDILFININEDHDEEVTNDTTIFEALYDEWNADYGSAVLSPELEKTGNDWEYKHHYEVSNNNSYFSPGTKMDGSPFF